MVTQREQIFTFKRQIKDVESRLEHLYDALETGSFSSDELAPRIRRLRVRLERVSLVKEKVELLNSRACLLAKEEWVKRGADMVGESCFKQSPGAFAAVRQTNLQSGQ